MKPEDDFMWRYFPEPEPERRDQEWGMLWAIIVFGSLGAAAYYLGWVLWVAYS